MSSNIDPAKLKVADLRNELSARGLDVKGTKPVLVKRLKEALEKELDKDIADTSIADTSTEENEETSTPRKSLRGSIDEKEETKPPKSAPTVTPPSVEKPKPVVKTPEKSEKPPLEKPSPKPAVKSPEKSEKPPVEKPSSKPAPQVTSPKKTEVKPSPTKVPEQPKPVVKTPEKPKTTEVKSPGKPKVESKSPVKPKTETDKAAEPPAKKSKLEQENGEQTDQEAKMEVQEESDKTEKTEEEQKTDDAENESEKKGEKRKRSSDSPEREQKRPRTPIKEDEPTIDAETVQLSWYDSDLNLQVDKNTFLSAKPLSEGAFGYIWAGARATHGVSTGKVCFEVKVTEKIKWEEYHRPDYRDNRFRTDHKRGRRDDRRHSKRDDEKSKEDSEKSKEDSEKSKDNSEKSKNDSEKSKDDSEKSKDDSEKSKGDSEKSKEDSEKSKEVSGKSKEDSEKSVEDSKTKDEPKKTEESSDTSEKKEEAMEVALTDKEEKSDKTEDAPKTDEPMETTESDDKKHDESGEKKEEENADEKKDKVEEPPLPTHFIRIGWSVASSSLQLGEVKHSYGYESSGKIIKESEFSDYGITFDADDVIGAYLDISDDTVTLQFTVNGQVQPSIQIPKADLPEDFVLYPHILSRNYSFELNFGEKEEPWFPIPSELEGYQYISKAENKVAGIVRPENRSDCEVLLMCGLPASGKTHWVKEHQASNLEKNYTILGNTSLLERMTISGEPFKSKYKGKWGILVDKIQKCLNRLVSTAALRRRNYIIDQTNVFPSAQRRKLRPFEGFKRKAVIVVNGDEEQARRQALQEALEGKEVPDSTLLEMKGAMILPETGDWLEEVIYVGAEEEEAKEIIKKYNSAGKAAGYGPEKRFNRDRWSNRRNDYHGGRNFQRQGSGGYNRQPYSSQNRWTQPRHGGGSGGGGWKDSRSRDWRGGSNYDRRDRDYYSQGSYSSRNQSSGGRSQGSGQRWGSSGSGGSSGGWGGQSPWNQSNYGRNYNQNWGGNNQGGQGGWGGKYGSSGGSGQGYSSWNYYGQQGQQSQNWGGQK